MALDALEWPLHNHRYIGCWSHERIISVSYGACRLNLNKDKPCTLSAKKCTKVLFSDYSYIKFVWIFVGVPWRGVKRQWGERGWRKDRWKHRPTFLPGTRHIILVTSRLPTVTKIDKNTWIREARIVLEPNFGMFPLRGRFPNLELLIDPIEADYLPLTTQLNSYSPNDINNTSAILQDAIQPWAAAEHDWPPTALSKSSSQHITNTGTRHCSKPSGRPRDFIIAFTAAPKPAETTNGAWTGTSAEAIRCPCNWSSSCLLARRRCVPIHLVRPLLQIFLQCPESVLICQAGIVFSIAASVTAVLQCISSVLYRLYIT